MKINYIAYLDPFDYQGGGEINLRGVIENGRERGHLINITSVYKTHKVNLFANPDFYILADIYNSPLSWRRLDEKVITKIINYGRYIHFSTAYAELCHQDYLPCNGLCNGTLCPFVKGHFNFRRGIIRNIIDIRPKKFKSKNCFRFYGSQLYKNAILNVFQSPMHRNIISHLLGDGIISEYFDLKPRIDSELFFNHNIQRDIDNIFVGVISEAKGWYEMKRNYSTKGNIVFIGNVAQGIKVDFGNHVGYISHKEIPNWMN